MGPQGLTGPKGDKGDAGADGANGADGAAGAQGPAGADGAQGPAGADRRARRAGRQGRHRATRARRARRATRARRAPRATPARRARKGDTGATGPQGPAGASGLVTAKEVYLDSSVALPADTTVAVTAISLPAGSYRLDGVTRLVKGAGTGDWACALNGDPAAPAATDDVDSGDFGHTQNIYGDREHAPHGDARLGLDRRAPLPHLAGGATARETKIIATPLGAANRVAGTAGASGS